MQNSKIKVMQIILNLDIGGAQEVVRTLVEYLASDDCELIVCTFKDGPLRQAIEQIGGTVKILPERGHSIISFPGFIADMRRIWQSLAELINKHKIDVVQTHLLSFMDFLMLPLLYTTRLRVVLWTFHNVNFELDEDDLPKYKWLLKPKQYVYRQLYRFAARLGSGFIAVSDEVKAAMVRVIGPLQGKITVICNGVNINQYGQPVDKKLVRGELGLDENARLLIVVGTLKEQKGHCYMIEAMASLVPEYPDLHLLLVGDGKLRRQLQAQTEELGLEEHIHFLGNRNDVPRLLSASDFFVLPSLWEGLAMALLEGMASGLPLVASEVSGTVQVVTTDETGILVPPGNTPQLVQALKQLLDDPRSAQALGAAARQRVVEEFSAQKQADEHLKLYYRLLGIQ
jgi:glycosyltransferase involved in cell wall biosynthesis